jgi:hypothetical protein
MCSVKYSVLNYLQFLREIIRKFQVVRKDISTTEAATSSRSSIPLHPRKADPNGEAGKDQLSDRVVVDRAWTGFAPRMVFTVRRGGGNDRDERNRSDDEPKPGCTGGMAELGRVAPVANTGWLDADLPEFIAGLGTETETR